MPVLSIADVFTSAGLATLGQVIMIDLMLAGDNLVVLSTLAARLPPTERRRVLGLGGGIGLVRLLGLAFPATTLDRKGAVLGKKVLGRVALGRCLNLTKKNSPKISKKQYHH